VERADAGAREACVTACTGASSVGRWRARGGIREMVERDVTARAGASSTQRAGEQALGGRRTGSASSAGTRGRAREWRDKAEATPVQQMRKKRSNCAGVPTVSQRHTRMGSEGLTRDLRFAEVLV
jgi:hypothetical protein